MTSQSKQPKEIFLGQDCGPAAITVNGLRLEVGVDGKSIRIFSDTPVDISYAANGSAPQTMAAIAAAKKEMKIGDVAADGWYCIGKIMNGIPLEMSPPTIMTWNEAYDAQHQTKRLPNAGQLALMYNVLTSNPKVLAAIAEGKISGARQKRFVSR